VGDSFEGVIASVTNFGFFVRLTEFGIDGLVHITALDSDYYRYDEVKQHLIGERSGTIYRLGDQLEVKVASVNLDERKIDFILPTSGKPQGQGQRKGKPVRDGKNSAPAKNTAAKNTRRPPKGKPADKTSKNSSGPKTGPKSSKTPTNKKPSTKSVSKPGSTPRKRKG
jgi:ribonuclease R